MNVDNVFGRVVNQIVDYLPSLAGGLLLVLIGMLAWWFVNRVVMQVLVVLRLHRLLTGFRWARGLSRVDVRLSIYAVIGNLAGMVVFLVFLNAAFAIMRLAALSNLVEQATLVIPRVVLAGLVFALGILVSTMASGAVRRVLQREGLSRVELIVSYVRGVLLVLFGAMALLQLGVAREIVIIGFTVVFVTLAALTVLVARRQIEAFVRKSGPGNRPSLPGPPPG